MKTFKRTAPAYWASYLINNDSSGLTFEDLADADKFMHIYGMPVDCEDIGFCRGCDATGATVMAGDVCEFTFISNKEGV